MKSYVLMVLTYSCLSAAIPPHPDVEAVRREEEFLPFHLRSPALHNPHLREVLPLSSSLHNGEKLVYQREAHDVTRKEIYNILTHAGFIRRQGFHQQQVLRHQSAVQTEHDLDIFNLPILQSQDFLQHL